MKNIFLVFLFAGSLSLSAQTGQVKESLKMKSIILNKEVEYSIYLPAGYETSNRQYPVLYLLHGLTGDETNWIKVGQVKVTADHQIQENPMSEMIIVMPDGGDYWYINGFDGKVKYEDFFVNEFIKHIDNTFRTIPEREARGIAGLSMGGHGALFMVIKHPDLFVVAAPLSAAVFTQEEVINLSDERWNYYFQVAYGKNKSADRLNDYFKRSWILSMLENANPDDLKKVNFYIDCGDGDTFIKGNMQLHALLIDKKIPHEFRVRNGMHDWNYWRTGLPEVLTFVATAFHH